MSTSAKQTKIYQILNSMTDDIYIGSTTQALYKRLYIHKSEMEKGAVSKLYTLMRAIGKDKFKIELIEQFPHNSVEQLHARELMYIRLRATLNDGVITCKSNEHRHFSQEVRRTETQETAHTAHDEQAMCIQALQAKVKALETQVESINAYLGNLRSPVSRMEVATQTDVKTHCCDPRSVTPSHKPFGVPFVQQTLGPQGLPEARGASAGPDNTSTQDNPNETAHDASVEDAMEISPPPPSTEPEHFDISDDDVREEQPQGVPNFDLTEDMFKVFQGKVDEEDIALLRDRYVKVMRIGKHMQAHPRDEDNKSEFMFFNESLANRIARLRVDANDLGLDKRCLHVLDTIEQDARIGKKARKKAAWGAVEFRKRYPFRDGNPDADKDD